MYKLENIHFCDATACKGKSRKGCISVVSSKNNNSRVSFAKSLLEEIGTPSTVEIGFNTSEDDTEKVIVVGENLGSNKKYTLKKHCPDSPVANIVYSKVIVDKIVEFFDLDFTDVTSQTFGMFEVQDINGKKTAIISK